MDTKEFANRLRKAREDCGISQQFVADDLNLPRTAITQIEAGNRSVSTYELTKLAKLYHRAIDYFFGDNQESEEELEVLLYRAEPSLSATPKIKKQLNHYVELCHKGVMLEKMLGREFRLGPPTYSLSIPRNKGEAVRQGELIAEQERKRLGIGLTAITDIVDLIASQGIWASSTNLPDTMSGLFLNHSKTGLIILVNASHVIARKRFSYAHEYAHALLDRDGIVRISVVNNNSELVEVRANAFAAAFLMPSDSVFEILRTLNKGQYSRQEQVIFDVVTGGKTEAENRTSPFSQDITYQDVAIIAHHFGVSYQAAVYRLRSLRHITQQRCDSLLAQESDGKNYLCALNMFDDLEKQEDKKLWDRELRNQLAHLSIEAYRREEISRGRLLELGDEIGIGGSVLYDLAKAAVTNISNKRMN